MGQSVSADREALELKDLFSLGQASPQRTSADLPHAALTSSCHHVKAWKFEKNGRAVTDIPVAICNEQGLFTAELQRTSSYLILHVQQTSPDILGDVDNGDKAAAALEEVAARAADICTPRGLATEVTPQSDAISTESQMAAGLLMRYAVFVWHGVDVEPHVKVRCLTKAFELERLLRLGLLKRRVFVDNLERAVLLKGVRLVPPSMEQDTVAEVSPASFTGAVGGKGLSSNRLLTIILGGNGGANLGLIKAINGSDSLVAGLNGSRGGASMATTANSGQRFPRLGLSVCRSLGVKPAADPSSADVRCQSSSSLGAAPTSAAATGPLVTMKPLGRLSADAGGGHSGGIARGNGVPLVPRLALGTALNARSHDDTSSMNVNGGPDVSLDSGGRKRFQGSELVPPKTARSGAPPLKLTAAMAAPKSARADCAALQLPPSSINRGRDDASDAQSIFQQKGSPGIALNLTTVGVRGSTIANRSDAPTMLNLEEINMTEEELINSYDPENEENNYHLPHHLYKQLQLKQYRNVCSEIVPGALFLSSYLVATELETLKKNQITHIVNTAADVCDSKFPDHFKYLTYYLKDTNNEEISILFYQTIEWIQNAINAGGRVLVHCREGVSRSSTMVLAYMMWRFSLPFEAAHDKIRKIRPICNPNTGFTCQLLLHGKKLLLGNGPGQATALMERPIAFYRVAPHNPKEPFLLLVPASDLTATSPWPLFDPRFGWVVQKGTQLFLWLGSQVPDKEVVQVAVAQHVRLLESFERVQCTVTIVQESSEPVEFWQVINADTEHQLLALATPMSCFDAEFELLSELAAVARTSNGSVRASLELAPTVE